MVRPLLPLHEHLSSYSNNTIPLIFALIAIFLLFSILTLLCASHDKIKPFKIHKPSPSKSPSNCHEKRLFPGFSKNIGTSGKALLKMVSWQRVQDEEEEEEEGKEEIVENFDDEDVVWRKTVIMGERCRPLDFSGKIEYDCEGNPLSSDDDKGHEKIKDNHKGYTVKTNDK